MTDSKNSVLSASFRDPSGFLFKRDGVLYRQVNKSYAKHYDACIGAGLYAILFDKGLLVRHEEVAESGVTDSSYRVIKPEPIPYISYPYEWSFSHLKAAALLTLELHKVALNHDMVLKDASAFNVQFRCGRPIFIDSLSFEQYKVGEPWIAYRQYCQHFLAPLALMATRDLRLAELLPRYIDGIPLDLTSKLLPRTTYLKYSLLAHIHLHSRSQVRHQDDAAVGKLKVDSRGMSKSMQLALIESLLSATRKLSTKDVSTEWSDYYHDTNYTAESMAEKGAVVDELAARYFRDLPVVHDLGANTGWFSRIVARYCGTVIAHDIDEMAVERHFREVSKAGDSNVLPLLLNLTNPTPAIGWDLCERYSFHERSRGSGALALALIHHLCISNNVPLKKLARFFASLFRILIIEFVPKEDSQVQRLLATREDIFDDYHLDGFQSAFSEYFEIKERRPVAGSKRHIFVMTVR